MSKKLIRLVVTCLICSLLCGNVLALSAAGENTQSGEVTRLEWLKALTDAFEMSVEERNYPDNYYSDIDDTSTDYYDIMLATEFGLIDVEAGDPLRPNDPATREFVAHTMNACMGYQLNDASYTFSESGSVSYPEDIQISIDRGWFALDNGSFFPEQAITNVEKDKLITIAKEAVASVKTDPDYHNQYQLAEGVVEIPENTQVALTDENQLTIYDSNISLKQGTVFVVICDGMPIARRALSVHVEDNMTIVEVEGVDVEEAFESMDVQGTIGSDLTQAQVIGDNVTLSYIVGGTEAQAYEDGVVLYSLEEVEEQDLPVSAVIATKTVEAPKYGASTYGLQADPGKEDITLNCKITNVSVDYGASLSDMKAHMIVSAKVSFSCKISTGDIPIPDFENPFVKVPIGVVGYFEPKAEGKAEGSVSLCYTGNLSVGVQWDDGVCRGVFNFTKKSFTIQAAVEASLGVKAAIGVDVVFLKAELYATAGAKASVTVKKYLDYDYPERCTHVTAHLYANGGGLVSFKIFGYKSTVKLEKVIYNEANSPVKVSLHYEDGQPVGCCTRDGAGGSESGSGGTGTGSNGYKYYTPINSKYAYSGANSGTTSSGEPYTIFEYSLDDAGDATITKYRGNVSALFIPDTLDGNKVVGIGANVFSNNTRLMLVDIPDSVTGIGYMAFSNCSNLVDVKLSRGLKTFGYSVFYNCDSITSIEIPKSLETVYSGFSSVCTGPFGECDNLKTVTFENETTRIAGKLFWNCSGLEEITIPDTVTIIENEAFKNCTNLSKVTIPPSVVTVGNYAFAGCTKLPSIEIPNSVTRIGKYAFSNCSSLQKIDIPDTVTEIDYMAFSNCSNLVDVKLSHGLKTFGYSVFYNCDSITSIEIPKSLETVYSGFSSVCTGPFGECDNLKTVTFENETTRIAGKLFWNCSGLEEITVPNTVTIIENEAFKNCTNLSKVTIPPSVVTVGNYAFAGCTKLPSIEIPNSVTRIGKYAFSNCSSLQKIDIPDTVTEIDYMAFSNCSNLVDVKLSRGLKTFGYSVFYNCDLITSIEIPKSLETVYSGFSSVCTGPFGECDNLKTVTFENGTTEIATGLFADCPGLEEITIPDTVTIIENEAFENCTNLRKVTIPPSVVTIGDYAFARCTKLPSIEIPNSVTRIGKYAFSNCSSLQKIDIPDTVTEIDYMAFSNCSNLVDVKLSRGLKTFGYSVFYNCDSITSIEIPKSLETVYSGFSSVCTGPFGECDNLKTVTFENETTRIAGKLFWNCSGLEEITVPNTVTIIENEAFKNCTNLSKVTIPPSVVTVGNYAFAGCTKLPSIELPNSVTEIGSYAFSNCSNLVDVTLSSSLENLGQYSFQNCGKLQKIEIPTSVTSIESYSFSGCTSLAEIRLSDRVRTIKDHAFQNSGLTSIDLPTGITSIGYYAFYNCDALKSIAIPDSVTSISTYAFNGCDVLANIKLGNGLTKIESYTFNLCPALQKITLPYRVATVASNAFTSCTSLTELVVPRATTSIASNAFSYPTKMTVYGVAGTYAEEWANSVNAKFVNQENPAESVTLNETEVTLNNGKTFSLVLTVVPSDFTDTVTWKSSNEAVATVSDTGVITAKGVGNATIRVTVGSKSASCKVTVVQPVTSISLNRTSLSLDAEETFALVASVYPTYANDRTVTWSSSDDSVASVDQDGNVTAHKKGTAVIAVTANDGSNISKNCTVTVLNSCFYCSSVEELESPHNYEDNCKDTWIYTLPGATKIAITFDERTCLEDEFDFLYLYDGSGAEIGKYTGTELAGKEILIIGDTVKLKMDSDDSGNEWGFKITKLEEFCEHTFSEKWTSDDDYHWHAATCGHDKEVRDKEEHIASDWIEDIETPGEEAVSRHKECTVCHRILIEEDLSPAEPVVLTQPVSAEVQDGSQATFTVSATGDGLTYQWQLCYAGDDTFRNCTFSGADTATLTVDATRARNGYSFRCVITDQHGSSITSDAAKLTIKADVALGVALTASQTTADSGEIVTFTAVGNGGDGNYQYKFIINDTTNDKWYKLQDYSANNTIEWKATTAGAKRIMVDIKDGTGKSVGKNVSVVVNGTAAPTELKGTLTASSYEVNPGDVVTLTANGIGGSGKYNYKFIINDKTDDKWYRLQDYGTNSVIQWTATTPGTKRLMVDVMDSNGKMFGTNITITVKAAEGVLNVADEIENADDVQDVVEDIRDTDTTQNPEVDLAAEE